MQANHSRLSNQHRQRVSVAEPSIGHVPATDPAQNNSSQSLLDTKGITSQESIKRKSDAKRLNRLMARRYDEAGEKRRAEKLRKCHSTTYMKQCTDCGSIRYVGVKSCDDRLCVICAKKRASRFAGAYLPVIEQDYEQGLWKHVAMYSLTYKNTPSLLDWSKCSKDVNRFIRELKKREGVYGGIKAFEITATEKKGFHPHWHVLVLLTEPLPLTSTGKVMLHKRREASEIWQRVNGGKGSIVDITSYDITSLNEAVKYVMKEPDKLPVKMLKEFLSFSQGKQFIRAFGKIYGRKVKTENQDVCTDCGSCDYVQTEYRYRPSRGKYVPVHSVAYHRLHCSPRE